MRYSAGHEANLPAKKAQTRPRARIPQPHAHYERPQHAHAPSPQGSCSPLGLMPHKSRLSHAEMASQRGAKRLQGNLFSLSTFSLSGGDAKFTCVVSKKVAQKAVDRNRLKRQCREVVRPLMKRVQHPLALVLTAKKSAATAPFSAIREDIERLIQSLQ